jgi:exodeoxyribonuclease-5
VCLANSKQGFFNGSIWYCQDILEEQTDRDRVVVALSSDDPMEEDRIARIHNRSLLGQEIHFTERSGAECMVSAQALTVHKFQGSEGRHIMILDESYTAREDSHRWLYTALTRAQERLTLLVRR